MASAIISQIGCEPGQVEQHLNPGAGLSSSSGCGYVMVECSFQCGATTTNGWRTRDGKLSEATKRNASC